MMRKVIFALMLAIVSSVWMMSEATCLTQAPDELYWSYITVSGTIQALPFPCEPGEDCPTCLTEAIVTNDKTYYLTTKNQQVADFLEHIHTSPVPAIYLLPLKATASGTPYQMGSFDYLLISSLNELYVEYFSDQLTRLPSLCDEWNVWNESFESFGPISFDKVVKYQLTTDTIIADSNYYSNYYTLQRYKRLEQDGQYLGAMREGNNRDIYYVPAGSTHEYLLYAFNAQEGDQLNNVWLGGNPEDYPYGWTMTVEAIQETNPRTFVLSTGFITTEEGVENYPLYTTWIEGVGFPETPHEVAELLSPADVGVYTLLCAYKNGEQIYVSEMGAEYGCEHDQTPETTDTIPLYYTGDDPGSSTVDPVDPNQVVVTLKGDELTIREHTGTDITYSLHHNAPAKMPAHSQTSASDTFRNEITLQITESGEYQLLLTNPSWNYSIYGTFFYSPQGINQTPFPSGEGWGEAHKILLNGRLLILRGEKIYTLQGQEVK